MDYLIGPSGWIRQAVQEWRPQETSLGASGCHTEEGTLVGPGGFLVK